MVSPLAQADSPAATLLDRILEGWNQFWFRPADPTVLGLIRISCGLLALYIHVMYSFHLQAWFGEHAWVDLATANVIRTEAPAVPPDSGWEASPELPPPYDPQTRRWVEQYQKEWGVDPRAASRGVAAWSWTFHVTDPSWMAVIHAAYLVVLVLFTLGVCTRITSVLAWIGALAYLHRSPFLHYGVDTMLVIALLYLMIGPSGAALSMDRLLERYRASRQALARGLSLPSLASPAPSASANFALRLIQVHVCLIYLRSGLAKLQGDAWWNGTALWTIMTNHEFSLMRFGVYKNLLSELAQNRWAWEIVMTAGTAFAVVVEGSFAFLIWDRRLRWPMLAAVFLLHVGIGFFMGLMIFSLTMLMLVLAFVPTGAVRRLAQKLATGSARLRLVYNAHSPRQVRAAAAVSAFDVGSQVAVVEQGEAERLRLEEGGRVRTGYFLYERIVRVLRLLWPLALETWIPGMRRVGNLLAAGEIASPKPPAAAAPVVDATAPAEGVKVGSVE